MVYLRGRLILLRFVPFLLFLGKGIPMFNVRRIEELDRVCAKSRETVVHFRLSNMDHEDSQTEVGVLAEALGLSKDELREYVSLQAHIREAIPVEIIAQHFGLRYAEFSRYVDKRVDELAQLRQREEEAHTPDQEVVFPFERRQLESLQEEAGSIGEAF